MTVSLRGGWLLSLLLVACHSESPPVRGEAREPARAASEPAVPSKGLLRNPESLRRFLARLSALERGRSERVGIVQLGASHTAALQFPDGVSRALAQRFGDAGPGYVPAAPMRPHFAAGSGVTERSRIEVTHTGPWKFENALHASKPRVWSLAGSVARGSAGATMRAQLCGECDAPAPLAGPKGRITLWMTDPTRDAELELAADAQAIVVQPRTTRLRRVLTYELRVAHRPRELTVRVRKGAVTVLGFGVERDTPGIVYDAVGLSGSSATVTDRWDKAAFSEQLRARNPSLVVFFYGTNESIARSFDPAAYRRRYGSLVQTVRASVPAADCLLISNTDRRIPVEGVWLPAPHGEAVETVIREVADAERCAFWSAREAMEGGVDAWFARTPPLALADRTHLTAEGYDQLASMLVGDLFAEYARRK